MSVFDDFWGMVTGLYEEETRRRAITTALYQTTSQVELDALWTNLSETDRKDGFFQQTYNSRKGATVALKEVENPLTDMMETLLDDWVEKVKQYDMKDPAKAKESLAKLSADVMAISGSALVVELALGLAPNSQGTVAALKMSQLMGWLGFGAVVTAVAHDPVKIGLLRPYQDTLEATFRNRRPMDMQLFLAYQQRSLSTTKIDDVEKITDELMKQIDSENEIYYDREIAKWGYSEYFSNALKDSATKTLSFGNLMALAKQGRLNRGMAIYSLWGYGLDRRLMKTALDALDQTNEVANYEGYRAVIERGYTDGLTSEADLKAYYKKLHVPDDVVQIAMPHLTKLRNDTLAKQKQGAPAKERDLTVSQVQSAYQNNLQDRAHSQNMIIALGYSLDEAKILLDLAELRRKLPSAQTLKRLPLSDYEKAHKNGILKLTDVLDRMKGEYTQADIDIEKKLLEIGKA